MKKMKKALLLVLCAVLLVGATIAGTLAYLTSQDTVVNTFTVGNVEIKLDEAVVDIETGKATQGRTEDGNTEVKLIPGRTIDKDPTVWVKQGSEAAYIRMKVTISNYDALTEIFGSTFLPQDYVEGWDSATWQTTNTVAVAADGKSATYEFRYKEAYEATEGEGYDELLALFETFTLPGENVTNTQLAKLEGLSITVVAEAIQAEGFADADAAWANFTNP